MRIAFLQSGLGAGGAEKNINILARHRHGLGDDVSVLAFNARADQSFFPYPPGIRLVARAERPGMTQIDRVFGRYAWLRARLRELRPEMLISFLTKNNVLAVLAARSLGISVIASERNNPTKQFAGSWWLTANRIICPRAAAFVSLTAEGRDALPPALGAIARVIGNPYTLNGEAVIAPGDTGRVVGVGRLVAQKGFDRLIDAFADVAPARPSATLTIFGDGPDRPALEARAAASGVGQRIRFPGVTRSPSEWLGAADIFVLSSRFEGYANVLAEAVCAGLPSIAFDCDYGPRTILDSGRAGILVPEGDVGALAAAMSRMLDDPSLRADFQSRCSEVRQRHSLETVLGEWDKLVASIMAPRLRRAP